MTDTPETLKAALADLAARVAAFEKARVEEEEPPQMDSSEYRILDCYSVGGRAATRLRYCERELARLREGLKMRIGDYPDHVVSESALWGSPWAMEIQRHRALLKDGGGK